MKLKRTRVACRKVRRFFRNKLLDTKALFRRRIDDKIFGDLISLFVKSAHHETCGAVQDFHLFIDKLGDEKADDKIEKGGKYIHRLFALSQCCVEDQFSAKYLSHFSEREKRQIKLVQTSVDDEWCTCSVDVKAAKKLVLKDLRKFRELILEIEGLVDERDRASGETWSKSKSDCQLALTLLELVENLCLDNFDLGSSLMHVDLIGEPDGGRGWEKSRSVVGGYVQYQAWKLLGHSLKPDNVESLGDLKVKVNPLFIELIVRNIITNAQRSAQEKGVDLEMKLSVVVRRDAIVLIFEDNGNGMTPDIMKKLNASIRVSTKPGFGEHGIGFQYSRELADKMDAWLHISSSGIGEGTTVHLDLKRIID